MRPNVIFTKLNAELFQFLAKSLPNRTSRFDAFLYLYERQTDHFDDLLKYGVNIPLVPHTTNWPSVGDGIERPSCRT